MQLFEAEDLDDGEAIGGPPRVIGRARCYGDPEDGRDGDPRPRDGVGERGGEPIGEERDAWRRAFRLLAGWQSGQHLRRG